MSSGLFGGYFSSQSPNYKPMFPPATGLFGDRSSRSSLFERNSYKQEDLFKKDKEQKKQPENPRSSRPQKKQQNHENIFSKPHIECQVFDESKFEKGNPKCWGNHELIALCTNPECECSFICDSENCKQCKTKDHLTCQRVQLQGMARLISNHVNKNKKFLDQTMKAFNQLEESFKQCKKSIENLLFYGDLQKQFRNTIESLKTNPWNIFRSKSKVSGQMIKQLYERLTKKKQQVQGKGYDEFMSLKHYQNEIVEITKRLATINKPIEQLLVQKVVSTEAEEFKCSLKKINSNILSSSRFEDIVKEQNIWKTLSESDELELIFRASEHEFKAEEFHRHCDDIEDTFTLVKTEFGNVIGGYSHYEWNKPNHEEWVNDEEKLTFLLMLDQENNRRLSPINSEKLIKCQNNVGPCFGEDLMISDKCDKNPSSSAFPKNYNQKNNCLSYPIQIEFEESQETTRQFCGATHSQQFKVKEYEVFKIKKP